MPGGGGPKIPFSGVLLVVFGGLLLADQLGALSFAQTIRDWWPALLILAGILNLIERPQTPFGAIVLVTAGAALLLHNLHIVRIGSLVRLWPIAMIAVGLNILLTSRGK
jgi:hypothetical protein